MRIGIDVAPVKPWTEMTDAERARATRLGDGVLYVGMNSENRQNARESALLGLTGPGARKTIRHGESLAAIGPDHTALPDGRYVDLSSPAGASEFAGSLGLDDGGEALADLLAAAPDGSRDELAQIASAFAEAERGGDVPSRLVLSGHSTGRAVYDGAGVLGSLRFTDVFALAKLMPRAAAQIEDVLLSACSSGFDDAQASGGGSSSITRDGVVLLRAWREHFPNLKTAWGYGGAHNYRSPTGETALAHIEAWELATRGRADDVAVRAAFARSGDDAPVGFQDAVSVWTTRRGYVLGR